MEQISVIPVVIASPVVAYHGTRAVFDEFAPSRTGAMGPAIYFTTHWVEAWEYAEVERRGWEGHRPRVIEVDLEVRRPYVISDVNESSSELFRVIDPKRSMSDQEVVQELLRRGYDCIYAVKDRQFAVLDASIIRIRGDMVEEDGELFLLERARG